MNINGFTIGDVIGLDLIRKFIVFLLHAGFLLLVVDRLIYGLKWIDRNLLRKKSSFTNRSAYNRNKVNLNGKKRGLEHRSSSTDTCFDEYLYYNMTCNTIGNIDDVDHCHEPDCNDWDGFADDCDCGCDCDFE